MSFRFLTEQQFKELLANPGPTRTERPEDPELLRKTKGIRRTSTLGELYSLGLSPDDLRRLSKSEIAERVQRARVDRLEQHPPVIEPRQPGYSLPVEPMPPATRFVIAD